MPRPTWTCSALFPIAFYLGAVISFMAAVGLVYLDSLNTAERVLTLRNGAPDPVEIQAFDPGSQSGTVAEVVLRAQIDTSNPLQVRFPSGLSQVEAVVFPLFAVDAGRGADGSAPPALGFAYYTASDGSVDVPRALAMLPALGGKGAVGPVVTLDGELGGDDALGRNVVRTLAQQGQPMASDLLVIAPYPEGRLVALSVPRPSPLRAVFFWIAFGCMLCGAILARRQEAWAVRRVPVSQSRGQARTAFPAGPVTQKGRSRLGPLTPQPELGGETPDRKCPDPGEGVLWNWARRFGLRG